jgi:hypothetical protein
MILRLATAGLFFLLIIFLLHISCSAGPIEEITELLNFIEQTECTFVRNGKQYDSIAARQHIEKKYEYYKKKIKTAEDFIQYSATKSSLTGKYYKVLCNGVRMNSSDWLKDELAKMRTR